MARKNIFGIEADPSTGEQQPDRPLSLSRPLVDLERPAKRASPVGALSSTLGGMSQRANRVDELERQLAAGQAVIDLDPALVDGSFVIDRLGRSDVTELAEQIRESGQQVPILVRPHPQVQGRYQVAYGHRRLAATRLLGRQVRAVVRELSDEQLVVSQGQENNARTDLSFIERSYFAYRLEQRGFSREIIMASLGVDKAALSRMISLVERLPSQLIEFIGPAPSFGRTRWAELAELVSDDRIKTRALKAAGAPADQADTSDERFQKLYDHLRPARDKPRTAIWKTSSGSKAVRISETDQKVTLVFDKAAARDFGSFIEGNLERLYAEYTQFKRSTQAGD